MPYGYLRLYLAEVAKIALVAGAMGSGYKGSGLFATAKQGD
jgi:hypothetical protein